MYFLGLVEKMAYCSVVVEGIDYVSHVLAHINLGVPISCKKLGGSVNEVGGEYLVNYALLVGLVDIIKTVAEQTEGSKGEDTVSTLLLELSCYVDNRVTGGNHIVYDNNVLARYLTAEILVSNDGVLAVDDDGVVASLVEHTEVNAHNGGIVHTLAHSALVGRDNHSLVGVDVEVGILVEHRLDHLICRAHVLKAVKRNGVLNSGVVSVEGDKVGDAHSNELLECKRTVERLSAGSLMLSALVEHRHYNADTASLTANSTDNSLKILKMVVGTHGYGLTVHIILYTVIEDVTYNINVVTSEGMVNSALCLTAAKSGAGRVYEEGSIVVVTTPFLEVKIYLFCEILAALHADYA